MQSTLNRISVYCPQCGAGVQLASEKYQQYLGRTVACRSCQHQFTLGRSEADSAAAALTAIVTPPAAAAPPRAAPSFQCLTCTGWFEAQSVYALPNADGYVCHRCFQQPQHSPVYVPQPQYAPQPSVVVQNIIHTQGAVRRWSPGVAALLSFLWPGLGQLYKGQVLNGLVWMAVVFIGYVCFIVPGLILHLCCILGAASGDPYR